MRWLPEATPRELTATIVIAGFCIVGDLTMIGLYVTSTSPVGPMAAIAIGASAIRIGCGTVVTPRRPDAAGAATHRRDQAGPPADGADHDVRR